MLLSLRPDSGAKLQQFSPFTAVQFCSNGCSFPSALCSGSSSSCCLQLLVSAGKLFGFFEDVDRLDRKYEALSSVQRRDEIRFLIHEKQYPTQRF